jgi:hypothetical protein
LIGDGDITVAASEAPIGQDPTLKRAYDPVKIAVIHILCAGAAIKNIEAQFEVAAGGGVRPNGDGAHLKTGGFKAAVQLETYGGH